MTESADLLIRNATLIDGTGAPGRRAGLAVAGDRIAALIEDDSAWRGEREIDAAGRVLAPGFIDVHTHDDGAALLPGGMQPKTTQGVTSVVVGNCGISLAPLALEGPPPPPLDLLSAGEAFRFPSFAAYRAEVERRPSTANIAALVGHSTLRIGLMAEIGRPAPEGERQAMREAVGEAMEAGALGLSSGLFYAPGQPATIEEVADLLGPVAAAGGLYTTHMRDEGDAIMDSLEETFETARRAGARVVISHHKCQGEANWGRSRETLARIDRARRDQEVGLDCYPYTASSTVLLPDYAEKAPRVIVTWSIPHPEHTARDLDEIAAEWGLGRREAAERLLPAGAIYHQMDEDDVRRILSYPPTIVASDGLPQDRHPHPRLWGTFPRVLGHYSRDVGLFPLATAVHKMTGLPARTFGLRDRGELRAGAHADLVLFDPETVADRADFEQPKQPAAGIDLVVVNGAIVLEAGRETGATPGRFLERAA